ncbi:hypothetical protein AAFF_G00240390 [Aldrovandia affinis]|uniref:Uncharacterized protein n=1 Tax=Aldrovandia affinis TaxID=143900 RepID=A0AAD7WU05_9TELE|nr:hypothetical protein AAFF_G00240390 [Aldrovandia affinis]
MSTPPHTRRMPQAYFGQPRPAALPLSPQHTVGSCNRSCETLSTQLLPSTRCSVRTQERQLARLSPGHGEHQSLRLWRGLPSTGRLETGPPRSRLLPSVLWEMAVH